MTNEPAAIGFRDHTGWAVAVVLAGKPGEPRFVHRERMELVAASLPRQVYHAVAEDGAPRTLVAEVAEAARSQTAAEFERLVASLRAQGFEVTAIAVAAGTHRLPPTLDLILRSHATLHAAEGELYRDCLAEAGAAMGVRTTRFAHSDLLSTAAATIGRSTAEITSRTMAMGRPLGPPWQKDHREAATAAWLALALAGSPS